MSSQILLAIMGGSCAFTTAERRVVSGKLDQQGQNRRKIEAGGLSPAKTARKSGVFSNSYAAKHDFPQVFAQVWKSLGGDQIPSAPRRHRRNGHCSIRAASLTGWYVAH